MNEGKDFVRTLHKLGYKSQHELQGENFDWLFEVDGVADFLHWFCENLNEDNYVSKKELEKFKVIKSSGKVILEGQELQDALQDIQSADVHLTDDKLREEIARLERHKKQCQERKAKLVQHRNKLSMHHTAISHRLAKMSLVEASAKKELHEQSEKTQTDNLQTNISSERLSKGVSDLCGLYTQSTPNATYNRACHDLENAYFLSQVSLEMYFREEEVFTQELTKYTKKQFFKDIGQIAGGSDMSSYSFLDVRSPTGVILHGENEEVFKRECKELARIQSEYPVGLYRNIKAQVQSQSTEAALKYLEQKSVTLQQNSNPRTESELRQQLHEAETKLQHVKRRATMLNEMQLKSLVHKIGELQTSRVLNGDYDLQIARQDYFTYKQEQVMKQLIVQKARSEFLTMSFEVEEKKHRQTHQLLSGISKFLKMNQQSLQSRMVMMSEPSLSPSTTLKQTIDSRDRFTIRLHQIIMDSEDQSQDQVHLFLKYATLIDGAKKLTNQLAMLKSSLTSSGTSRDDTLALLECSLNECEEMLYSDSATKGGFPQLCPREIAQSITQLTQLLDGLEEKLLEFISTISAKHKTLQSNRLLATERNLFVYFFTKPAKLRQLLADLSARVQASKVS
ncbi:HAUS augmin-like complex subunit 3 [Glandiceps talaboti]